MKMVLVQTVGLVIFLESHNSNSELYYVPEISKVLILDS